jgi:hypothetical protein
MPKQLEPKDKLGADMVNGPEDLPPATDLDTGRLGLGRLDGSRAGGTATAAANLQGNAGWRSQPTRMPSWLA